MVDPSRFELLTPTVGGWGPICLNPAPLPSTTSVPHSSTQQSRDGSPSPQRPPPPPARYASCSRVTR